MGLGQQLDSLIGAVSPSWQKKRTAARWQATVLERGIDMLGGRPLEQRRYAAASVADQTSTWIAPSSSANTEIASSLGRMRSRSRQLVRDEGWVATAIRRIVSNAIGEGLRCTVEHPDPKKRAAAQKLWNRWARSANADADGRLNFYGLQRLALREVIEGGDILARRRWRRFDDGGVLPFQIQLLEGEHLDGSRDTLGPTSEGLTVKQGIVFDARGRRVGYYLWREHPGEFSWRGSLESVFVPSKSVAHSYRVERTGQVCGVPWGAPVLLVVRMLGDWKHASLYRLQAAACLVAFVTDIEPDDPPAPGAAGNATGHAPSVLNPGAVEYLKPGQTVSFSNPPGVQGVDNFARLNLLEIAGAYGLTYEALTNDMTGVSYTSGRMSWLEMARELKTWREDVMVTPFCEPVFRWFLEAAEVAGLLVDDGEFESSWTPTRREFVDAKKEIEGTVAQVRAGLSTWSEEARANGWSPEELIAEYVRDLEMLDAAGLSFETDPRRAATPSTPAAAPAKAEADDGKPAVKDGDKAAGDD